VILVVVMVVACVAATPYTVMWIIGIIHAPPSFVRLTSQFPACDRIIVDAIEGSENDIQKIDGTKELNGTSADEFVQLWRSQPFIDGPGDLCHSPIYRFRFFRSGSLYAEATICFGCNNVYFLDDAASATPQILKEIAFNSSTAESRQLRDYLAKLFPGHDPGIQ
jgi:hypothetical protein